MNSESNKILVPLDFSEHSLSGLEQSYNFARLANAEIVLLHVIVESGPIWGLFSVKEQEDVVNKIEEKLNSYADLISKREGVKVSTLIKRGKLIDKILKVSKSIDAKLIVVGTTGSENIKQKVVGSNALRLIREAKCPVITVKGTNHRKSSNNIILPLDLTKETNQKVSTAITIAKYFHSKIWAVSIVNTKDQYLKERLKVQLNKVRKHIESKDVECSVKMIKSESKNEEKAAALINFSNEVNGDLITIMTQQESEVIEFFIGSLAKEIIHRSNVPVMSVIPNNRKK